MAKTKSTLDDLDEPDRAALQLATKRLERIAVGEDTDAILEALAQCVPAAAGLIALIKLAAIPGVTNHPLRLPTPLLESWMGTQPDQFEQALRPVLLSNPGDFWRDTDTLPEKLRDKLEVLHRLDRFNLGEGAGYKVYQRILPGGSTEHMMMALITERGCRFPSYSSVRLKALAPMVQNAVLRLGLPLIASRPILGQIMAEEHIGYVCLDTRGVVTELNQRAHELACKYRDVASIPPGNQFLQEFIDRARTKITNSWQLMHPSRLTVLDIRLHALAKETHMIPYDMQLLKMQEWTLPTQGDTNERGKMPTPDILSQSLTPRQQEVAALLARSGLSYKQIADHLDVSDGTLRKHAEHIYRALKIHSRPELVALIHCGGAE